MATASGSLVGSVPSAIEVAEGIVVQEVRVVSVSSASRACVSERARCGGGTDISRNVRAFFQLRMPACAEIKEINS